MTYHLGAGYFEGPEETFVSQPKKYIDKLADTYRRLFNDDPPKVTRPLLTKMITQSWTPLRSKREISLQNILLWWANFNGWLLWGDLTSMLK